MNSKTICIMFFTFCFNALGAQNTTYAVSDNGQYFGYNLTTKREGIGKNDMRLAALLSMNLASKEIAAILNISDEGVKKARYRLRKK